MTAGCFQVLSEPRQCPMSPNRVNLLPSVRVSQQHTSDKSASSLGVGPLLGKTSLDLKESCILPPAQHSTPSPGLCRARFDHQAGLWAPFFMQGEDPGWGWIVSNMVSI